MIGKTISHYKILDKIGEGGMGVVYKAQDTKLDRLVALKFLPEHLLYDPTAKARFIQEAKGASAINHPNISTIYEIDEAEGKSFIAMEFIDGKPLRELIEKNKLAIDKVIDMAIQICEGLHKAHQSGIVHRDIKPENMLVAKGGLVKILDFGLAKLKGVSKLTQTGTTTGTVAYMSPEQAQGGAVDHQTDIWSLGIVLYEMVTGQLPFKAEYEQAVIYSILNENAPPITSLRTEVPIEFERLVNKCLEKQPYARYQNVNELLVDLGRVQKTLKQLYEVPAPSLKSIAVLPFDNISPDKDNEYFSDGLTEEIITNLSKIRTLKVISRTSIMRYKGMKKSLKQIASELGVQYILEGSVRKHGNDLRITAQLIDATQDAHLWVEKYRGTVEDVFDIQEKVAGEIARALKIQLTPHEQEDLKKCYTCNTEAYQLYLKGRYYWNKRTEEGMLKGIEYFKQTIKIDPGYALAYVGLADAYILLGVYNYLPPNETMPKAKVAALRALEIDDLLGEGHASLAHLKMLYDWDWLGAEKEFKRAIELNPGYAPAHQWYTLNLSWTGRLDEAMAEIKKAQELDPLSLIINTDVGLIHYLAGRYDQAIEQCQKTLEIDPNFFVTHLGLGFAYEQKGMFQKAINELQQALALSGGSTLVLAELGRVYAMSGNKEEAQKIAMTLNELSQQKYVSPYSMARLYLCRGEIDLGFEWLYKAVKEKSLFLIHAPFNVDPCFKDLNSDSRFTELLKKMGLEK